MWMSSRASRLHKLFSMAILIAFGAAVLLPMPAASQGAAAPQGIAISDRFQQVVRLRANAQYDEAVAELHAIIIDYAAADKVLREAFNHLVFTYDQNGDMENVRAAARQALERFPNLIADELQFPPRLNGYYEDLRGKMFGALTINEPEGCRVFLSDSLVGETPLVLALVPIGDYTLTLTKSGHHDYMEAIRIDPGVPLAMAVTLKRKRGWRWWTYRVGSGVVAVTLLAVGLSGSDDGGGVEEPEPLPGPPDPPPTN